MPRIPTSRLGRTAKLGGLVAGQGARWLGTRAADVVRSDERADRARGEWALRAADELVEQLGQMKGAAMKIGQVLSTVDWDVIPEGEREGFKERLGALRDAVPPADPAAIRRVVEQDLGGPLSEHFADFSEQAVAAASIGQVHRATTHDGRDVAVKIQYPGIAEAVETDLRNVNLLFPLIRRLAPGLDVKAIATELRERIGEELDYEIEAQHQRTIARAFRGHPFVKIPEVDTELSTRRVLVTEFVEGAGFEAMKRSDEATRDRIGEILFRFFYGLLTRERLSAGDPHPGNYLYLDDRRVCFLDFGLMRKVPAAYLDGERALARAVVERDAHAVHRGLAHLGYLPDPDGFDPQLVLDQLHTAGEWYFTPGFRRLDPAYVRNAVEVGSSPRSPYFEQMRRQTVPPEALLIRRMEGLLFAVLGELRAGADWSAMAQEYIADAPPSTELGRIEAAQVA
ncbi:MAG TPA: AarF/ABC1/UbiB kinase family protein [Solirubrobacteraceae bacterium]|nr:AarF/ABC1/UbiB kinase family protein [Solirubrobacteraceae bacterium]